MTDIVGEDYRLAGFQLATDDRGDMCRIFAVFSRKDQDPETLHVDYVSKMMDVMSGELDLDETEVYSMYAYDILSAATDPQGFASGEREYLKPVIDDLGAENLSKALQEMTSLRFGKLDGNARYYVAATDRRPRKASLSTLQ